MNITRVRLLLTVSRNLYHDGHKQFLAVRTNGCAYDVMLLPSGVSLSSVRLSSVSYVLWLNGTVRPRAKVTVDSA